MLQELRDTVADATELIAEIGRRFGAGDPADEQLARLADLMNRLSPVPGDLPDDLRAALTALSARFGETVAAGSAWLAESGPALAAERIRGRLNRAYGVPPRPQ